MQFTTMWKEEDFIGIVQLTDEEINNKFCFGDWRNSEWYNSDPNIQCASYLRLYYNEKGELCFV